VVERDALPVRRGMANTAILRVPLLRVVGASGCLIILDVATIAIGGRRGERSAGMADVALQRGVSAGQRELGGVVIELRALPVRCGVAAVALIREIRQRMIGIGGVLEIGQVTARAVGGRCRELVVLVTGGTLDRAVSAGQREGRAVVVKRRALPAQKAMAHQTIMRKAGRDVVRILRVVEVAGVAAIAIHWRSRVAPAHVALRAFQRGMSAH